MKLKIKNKKKFTIRITEILIIIIIIILTIISIKYANQIRGYRAVGGECLIPIFGLLAIIIIETIYEESEERKSETKKRDIRKNNRNF